MNGNKVKIITVILISSYMEFMSWTHVHFIYL